MGTIPFPERYVITPASENDGTVFKRDLAPDLQNKRIMGAFNAYCWGVTL